MKSNDFWVSILAKEISWATAYPMVEIEAREYLSNMPLPSISTNGLVEGLFPMMSTRGPGIDARHRLYKALFALAAHSMRDCATPSVSTKKYMGRETKPLIWTKPKPKCKACNGTGLENAS